LDGKRYQINGFGTFSTCARKAAVGRPACKMIMFRASKALYDYSAGKDCPAITGPHSDTVLKVIDALHNESGVDIHSLGRMAVLPVSGKQAKIIFHGDNEFNSELTATL